MEKNIEYKVDKKRGIFYKFYSGDVSFDDLTSSWEAIIMKKIIPSDIKKFILDYRGANIMYGPEKSKDIAKFYAMHDKVFGKSKIALVMDKPEQVVFPMLVETEGVNFMLHPFFSIEAALEWVL